MESAQARVQDAVTDMVNTLDKEHIRKLQVYTDIVYYSKYVYMNR